MLYGIVITKNKLDDKKVRKCGGYASFNESIFGCFFELDQFKSELSGADAVSATAIWPGRWR